MSAADRYAGLALAFTDGPPRWDDARRAAASTLASGGLPTARDEAWRYTRPASFDGPYVPATGSVAAGAAADLADATAAFVDGRLLGIGEAPGASIRSIREVPPVAPSGPGFDALNAALARDGAAIYVPPDRAARAVLGNAATGGSHLGAVRHTVTVAAGGRLELVERFVGDGPAFTSASVRVTVEAGAELVYVREVAAGAGVLHHGAVSIDVHEGGKVELWSMVSGGATVRVEVAVGLLGPRASAALRGLTLAGGRGAEHVDHHVLVRHVAPSCTSRQVFRALADGRGRSVFTGAIDVAVGASGTDAGQVHRALLLSDDAAANARPQLTIRTDDVKCAHGAAIGALDDASLFYLRQRGLDMAEARGLLTAAFAAEIVDPAPASVRERLARAVDAWMGR